ncbi:hypothetical protein D3C87_687360 [compost metagenome]
MASISLGSMRKDLTGGLPVMTLAIDGKAFFCFIGWMQHTRPDMLSLNSYGSVQMLEVAKGLAGLPVNRSYRVSRTMASRLAADFARQQATARDMNPMHLNAKAKAYAIQLQRFAAHLAAQAATLTQWSLNNDNDGRHHVADEYRTAAVQQQARAANRFVTLAGVRGLFDTTCMDDAHAVEVEPSRVGPVSSYTVRAHEPEGWLRAFAVEHNGNHRAWFSYRDSADAYIADQLEREQA